MEMKTGIFYRSRNKKFVEPDAFNALNVSEKLSLIMSYIEIHGGIMMAIRVSLNGGTFSYLVYGD